MLYRKYKQDGFLSLLYRLTFSSPRSSSSPSSSPAQFTQAVPLPVTRLSPQPSLPYPVSCLSFFFCGFSPFSISLFNTCLSDVCGYQTRRVVTIPVFCLHHIFVLVHPFLTTTNPTNQSINQTNHPPTHPSQPSASFCTRQLVATPLPHNFQNSFTPSPPHHPPFRRRNGGRQPWPKTPFQLANIQGTSGDDRTALRPGCIAEFERELGQQ